MLTKIADFLEDYEKKFEEKKVEFFKKYRETLEAAWTEMLTNLANRGFLQSNAASFTTDVSDDNENWSVFNLILRFPDMPDEDYNQQLMQLVHYSYSFLLNEIGEKGLVPTVTLSESYVHKPIVIVKFTRAYVLTTR
jgi:hypothetical protein